MFPDTFLAGAAHPDRYVPTNLYILALIVILLSSCAALPTHHPDVCRSLEECAPRIKIAVEKAWSRPPGIKYQDLSVELRITLGKQHEVQSISVNKSSGNDEFDRSAINAVRKAGQFPELEGLTNDDAKRFETIVLWFKPKEHN